MSKNQFTGTATQPHFCQFNKDQYCSSLPYPEGSKIVIANSLDQNGTQSNSCQSDLSFLTLAQKLY